MNIEEFKELAIKDYEVSEDALIHCQEVLNFMSAYELLSHNET